jgi:hypothetical protein
MGVDMALDTEAAVETTRLTRRPWFWVAVLLSFALVGWVGYVAGEGRTYVHTATVHAYVGLDEASFPIGGETAGLILSAASWTDADGGFHDAGDVPSCLTKVGDATIRLSWVPASADGVSWRDFFWIDCRATHYTS